MITVNPPASVSCPLAGVYFLGDEMEYKKPFLSFEEQANLLIGRGMICDKSQLIKHLQDVGYYRLSGYWFSFKNPDNSFNQGTNFRVVWDTYTFDRQLRLIVLDAIERVEVYLRTQLAYNLAKTTNPFGYMDRGSLPRLSETQYNRFIERCKEGQARSYEQFTEHFKEQYGDTHELPPYWMLVGTMDFGQTLTLYRGAPNTVRYQIANQSGVSAKVFESWLVSLNTIRNICAHHSRLWNRVPGTKPMIPRKRHDSRWHEPYAVLPDRLFCSLTILSYLLENIAPLTKWRSRLFSLFNDYPHIPIKHMGFNQGWENCPFWERYIKA